MCLKLFPLSVALIPPHTTMAASKRAKKAVANDESTQTVPKRAPPKTPAASKTPTASASKKAASLKTPKPTQQSTRTTRATTSSQAALSSKASGKRKAAGPSSSAEVDDDDELSAEESDDSVLAKKLPKVDLLASHAKHVRESEERQQKGTFFLTQKDVFSFIFRNSEKSQGDGRTAAKATREGG